MHDPGMCDYVWKVIIWHFVWLSSVLPSPGPVMWICAYVILAAGPSTAACPTLTAGPLTASCRTCGIDCWTLDRVCRTCDCAWHRPLDPWPRYVKCVIVTAGPSTAVCVIVTAGLLVAVCVIITAGPLAAVRVIVTAGYLAAVCVVATAGLMAAEIVRWFFYMCETKMFFKRK